MKNTAAENITSATHLSNSETAEQNEKTNAQKSVWVKSCVIEVPDQVSDNQTWVDKIILGAKDEEHLKSVVVDILTVIKPPSVHWSDEEDTISESGSTLTTVTSLSTLDVSSLSEGEVVLAT